MRFHILDTETIGLYPPETGGGVCEVSVREVNQNLELLSHHYAKLYPEAPISAAATATHGLFNEDVAHCPTMDEWLQSGEGPNWSEGSEPIYFIAHNAKFDWKFLAPYIRCEAKLVDTLLLARRYFPDAENHQLQTLRVMLKMEFSLDDQHSAGGDTKVLLDFVHELCKVADMSLPELCEDAQRREPIIKMPFGKHRGKLIADIRRDHPDYVRWALKNMTNMDPDLKEAFTS